MNNITIVKPKIKRVRIKDCGIIKNADIKLKDGLNAIKGVNASGKTTVINAINSALRKEPRYKGKVEIEFFNDKIEHKFIKKKEKKIDTTNLSPGDRICLEYTSLDLDGTEAVIIDDALAKLNNQYEKKVLEFFRRSKSQLIFTCQDEIYPLFKANIIDTKDFSDKNV